MAAVYVVLRRVCGDRACREGGERRSRRRRRSITPSKPEACGFASDIFSSQLALVVGVADIHLPDTGVIAELTSGAGLVLEEPVRMLSACPAIPHACRKQGVIDSVAASVRDARCEILVRRRTSTPGFPAFSDGIKLDCQAWRMT